MMIDTQGRVDPFEIYTKPDESAHTHVDSRGYVHWCYHKTRSMLANWQFWLGVTMSFPLEHLIWEKLWPLKLLTHWWGL